jgi:hypothetical protein
MSHVRRFDHVGVTVADLEEVTTFFVGPVRPRGQTALEDEPAREGLSS